MYWMLAWRMASLCMSWPVQAGIMSFRTPNSSFILDRRLLSIRLWAVLRAIFRPAVVEPGACFRLEAGGAVLATEAAAGAGAMAGWRGPLGDRTVSSLEDWR